MCTIISSFYIFSFLLSDFYIHSYSSTALPRKSTRAQAIFIVHGSSPRFIGFHGYEKKKKQKIRLLRAFFFLLFLSAMNIDFYRMKCHQFLGGII